VCQLSKQPVITIDGPAGAGKTTVSQRIANRYQFIWVDTGALYRGITLVAREKGIAPDDSAGLEKVCHSMNLHFVRKGTQLNLFNHDQDLSAAIRTPEISLLASKVSAQPVVRQYLLSVQRQFANQGGAVFEGRDMGTVVFPDADIKFFLDANHDVRTRRRFDELQKKSIQTSFDTLSKEMKQRDLQDKNRDIAPLKAAPDAIHIDASEMSIDAVVNKMALEINKQLKGRES